MWPPAAGVEPAISFVASPEFEEFIICKGEGAVREAALELILVAFDQLQMFRNDSWGGCMNLQ